MDLEFFVHGVPKGQKIWGKDDDLSYIQNFYVPNNDETKFLVEIRTVNGKNYCYYSYLKYNNIVACDGRAGSYFGMSLRIDECCTDVVGIYRLMDIVYNRYVIGCLLSTESAKKKFLVSDFQAKNDEIKGMLETIMSLMRLSIIPSDFVSNIQQFQASKVNSIIEFNLEDCVKENIWDIIKQCAKVAISPYYPTLKDKNIQKKIEEQMAEFTKAKEREVADVKSVLEDRSKQISDLNQQIQLLSSEKEGLRSNVDTFKSEKRKLENQIRLNENKKNVVQLVSEIRDPLTNLSKIISSQDDNYQSEAHGKSREDKGTKEDKSTFRFIMKVCLPILQFFLLIVIVVLCSFRAYNKTDSKKNEKMYAQIEEILKKESDKSKIKNNTYAVLKNQTKPDLEYSIDIEGYSGSDDLKVNNEYTLKIINATGGEWKVVEGSKSIKVGNNNEISIKSPGEVTITYVVNGLSIASRTVKASR